MQETPDGEVSREDVAYIADRVRAGAGRPQLYGTQLRTVEGRMVLKAVEDPAKLNRSGNDVMNRNVCPTAPRCRERRPRHAARLRRTSQTQVTINAALMTTKTRNSVSPPTAAASA